MKLYLEKEEIETIIKKYENNIYNVSESLKGYSEDIKEIVSEVIAKETKTMLYLKSLINKKLEVD